MSTILVVDDYVDALQVWDLYLQAAGYRVLTAADGRSALAEARIHTPDLIVLDLELPDLSGIEVARMLEEDETTRHIPKVAVTGYSQAPKLAEARRSGFDEILLKPCDPEELIAVIHRLLDEHGPDNHAAHGKAVPPSR